MRGFIVDSANKDTSHEKKAGLLSYLTPIRLMPDEKIYFIFLFSLGTLLESIITFSLYPVIADGLHETTPFLIAWKAMFFDRGISEHQFVAIHLLTFVVLGSCSSAARWLGEAKAYSHKGKIEHNSRKLLANALKGMNWANFTKLGPGKSIHLLATSSDKLAQGTFEFTLFLGYALSATILMAAMVVVSPSFGSAALAVIAIAFFVQRRLSKKARETSQIIRDESVQSRSGYVFLIQNLKYCRSSGFAEEIYKRADASSSNEAKNFGLSSYIFAKQRILLDAGTFSAIALVLAVVIIFSPLSFSKASVFLAMLYRMLPKLVGANLAFQYSTSNAPFAQLWTDAYTSAMAAQENSSGNARHTFVDSIEFKDISYSYESGKQILTDLNLTIRKNSFVAVIGESGSGKSTILDLLTGLLQPTRGSIRIDDTDLADLSLTHWRNQIGLVMQETPLVRGTVLENITLCDKNPDREWAMECARIANAEKFINHLPEQYDTFVGERQSLSGGEVQRLALARALYSKPSILILDEPTSALDAQAEERFVRCIDKLNGKMTIIMVTHRLATIAKASDVLVLQHGKVLAYGPQKTLMEERNEEIQKLLQPTLKAS